LIQTTEGLVWLGCEGLAGRGQVSPVWGPNIKLVVAGLTNTYASYIATYEEYAVQRYEGASTVFGPHTLDAYIQVLAQLPFQD
jgi:neutral ceramidase